MNVTPEPLPESPIVRLVAAETRRELDICEGDDLGYWCSECGMAEETRAQIVHGRDCDVAGEHGRALYGSGLDPIDGSLSGEFQPETAFTLLEWATTQRGLASIMAHRSPFAETSAGTSTR